MRLTGDRQQTLHFTEVLADHLGTDISHVCLTNGSAEGIRYIIQAFTSVNGRIVGVVPSYFMFQVYSEMYGRNFVKVSYKEDLSMDVNDIIREMTDDTQLLILLNPNNPIFIIKSGHLPGKYKIIRFFFSGCFTDAPAGIRHFFKHISGI